MPEALRTRLVDVNARLGRITAWPWAADGSHVVAPPVRVSIPRPGMEGLHVDGGLLSRWDALDDIEYYGGELICESVSRENADLIAHAPSDLALLADATLLLLRDRDRLRHLMHKYQIHSRRLIDIEIRSRGAELFTLARAELPRIRLEA